MLLLTLFVASCAVALSGAMVPGPLLTATIGCSTRWGLLAALYIVLGHGLVEGLISWPWCWAWPRCSPPPP
jgi:threonine/homoserine/homoserine lactone efflux protein